MEGFLFAMKGLLILIWTVYCFSMDCFATSVSLLIWRVLFFDIEGLLWRVCCLSVWGTCCSCLVMVFTLAKLSLSPYDRDQTLEV
jgi:hypothetical protein